MMIGAAANFRYPCVDASSFMMPNLVRVKISPIVRRLEDAEEEEDDVHAPGDTLTSEEVGQLSAVPDDLTNEGDVQKNLVDFVAVNSDNRNNAQPIAQRVKGTESCGPIALVLDSCNIAAVKTPAIASTTPPKIPGKKFANKTSTTSDVEVFRNKSNANSTEPAPPNTEMEFIVFFPNITDEGFPVVETAN
ncbi:hypothetical protein PRIPAC_79908 [Pristionchus pacificus]|uniref:Uncharacterized protein n=1 Tax=Pristionchus pacificus TaxID=54126 RepID=A0A2A6CQV4_PRIPA|nr:hypothetical protein PRIPAC_79908 [Pristionchus pacificus]|eukprot:PDM80423.1 hypothetical protein PRIPAC_33002 [Pristionchus pacificus]